MEAFRHRHKRGHRISRVEQLPGQERGLKVIFAITGKRKKKDQRKALILAKLALAIEVAKLIKAAIELIKELLK